MFKAWQKARESSENSSSWSPENSKRPLTHVFVTKGDLEQTIQDFMPPAYPHEIELQNLVAVLECTSREMVPRRFREMSRDRLVSEIKQLKVLLHERE
jgi:hypothetical protein